MKRILVIQTAFIGDVILTLPLVQVLSEEFIESKIDLMLIPQTSELVKNNPLLNEVMTYDKRNTGIIELAKMGNLLKRKRYDLIISPHRSARSAMLSSMASPKMSISFSTSALSFLYNKTVSYIKGIHEIRRNLSLLKPVGITKDEIIRPELYIGEDDSRIAADLLNDFFLAGRKYAVVAHGSVWHTKRYPEQKVAQLVKILAESGVSVVLTGAASDAEAAGRIVSEARSVNVFDATGRLSILQSAEMIRRSSVLITNDSAPLHLGNSVGTPVYAIFGSTVTRFGFYPYGDSDRVYEVEGLPCRPCGIHGRRNCPLGTLECMYGISEKGIAGDVLNLIGKK